MRCSIYMTSFLRNSFSVRQRKSSGDQKPRYVNYCELTFFLLPASWTGWARRAWSHYSSFLVNVQTAWFILQILDLIVIHPFPFGQQHVTRSLTGGGSSWNEEIPFHVCFKQNTVIKLVVEHRFGMVKDNLLMSNLANIYTKKHVLN
jgi:hypothetical protein